MSVARTTARTTAPIDAQLRTGPDDRLHNSGWGRPPEQYCTPAVGARFQLDYMWQLRCWPGADPADAAALAAVRHGVLPAPLVARYAWRLARAIGGGAATCPDAVDVALADLVVAVMARGLVEGVVLTARPMETYKVRKGRVPPAVPTTDEQAALSLATVASCAPPLVLFGREPSLTMLRSQYLLLIGRLRRTASSPDAERVWGELQTLGTWGDR